MLITPYVFPANINKQSIINKHISSLFFSKCDLEQCLSIGLESTNNKKIIINNNKYYLHKYKIKNDFLNFINISTKNIIHNKKIKKIKIRKICILNNFNVKKVKKVNFEIKKIKIRNVKSLNILNEVKVLNFNLIYIKYEKAVKKIDFITSPFDIDDIQKYITKDSPYKLIIKFRKINKIIYPRTHITYYNKPTKRI